MIVLWYTLFNLTQWFFFFGIHYLTWLNDLFLWYTLFNLISMICFYGIPYLIMYTIKQSLSQVKYCMPKKKNHWVRLNTVYHKTNHWVRLNTVYHKNKSLKWYTVFNLTQWLFYGIQYLTWLNDLFFMVYSI
jgi:hypothetical protein